MTLMNRRWPGIEKRIVAFAGLIAAQQVAGHINEATTLIYQELPEWSMADALQRVGGSYESS